MTIFSVANCLGRVGSGVFGDYLAVELGKPRPLAFSFFCGVMGVAQVLVMLGSFELLYVAVPLAGVSYGAFNALCPTLISEIFGNDYFGAIYATNSISNGERKCSLQ